MTFHNLMSDLETYLNLTPEQKFRVAAKIKRHIHSEKSSVYFRTQLNLGGCTFKFKESLWVRFKKWLAKDEIEDAGSIARFMEKMCKEKVETHDKWRKKSDHEVITWDMGQDQFPKLEAK